MANKTRDTMRSLKNVFFALAVVFATSITTSQVDAATYFISPTGSDSNSGNSSSPWKTFGVAIPKLHAGDTLILRNGIYNGSNTKYPNIDCSTNAANGTSSQPITIQAENERQAFIQADSIEVPFYMRNCSWWIVQGLHVENADIPNGSGPYPAGDAMHFENSHNITVRRNLLARNNRYFNSGLMAVGDRTISSDLLIEENELYSFHRHGLLSSKELYCEAELSKFARLFGSSRLWRGRNRWVLFQSF